MKRVFMVVFMLVLLFSTATPLLAQGSVEADTQKWGIITAGFAMALASVGCAMAQGKAIYAACEGLARNPGAAPSIRFVLLLGLVLIESLALYTLLIVFVKVTV